MVKKLKIFIATMTVSFGLVAAFMPSVMAVELFDACDGNSDTAVCKSSGPGGDNAQNIVSNIVSMLMWIVGVVSVIMIIISGIKYVTSNGDSQKIQSAKNTLLYSVIGLVVAIAGQLIVFFVIDRIVG